MLQEADITRHQRGSGEAKHLPEGKVPGHHGENGSDGPVADETLLSSCIDDFVGQEALCILGVVAAASGGLEGLAQGGLVGLAHFERHQMGELVLVAFENFGGLQHAAGTLAKWSLAFRAEGAHGLLELLFDLRVRKRLEGLDYFAGGGIGGGNGHDECSFECSV